jgi:hypothetical protein
MDLPCSSNGAHHDLVNVVTARELQSEQMAQLTEADDLPQGGGCE